MRILMTADPIGGVWQYALELCQALEPYGAQVMLATLGASLSDQQRREVHRLPHVELCESQYLLEWMQSPWESLQDAAKWLLKLEGEFFPHVIHLNHLLHADLPWQAPVLSVGHSCVLSWWEAVRGDEPVGWARYQGEVARSLRAARRVCAPTNDMLMRLQRHYGPLKRCQVIPNGRNPEQFRARPKLPFILTAGRLWDAAKNIEALCTVAPRLSWPVFVAGSTSGPDGEEQTLEGVHTLGTLSPSVLGDWYSRASIYALPARYEPFGLTVLEAALSGCALVLGDIESLREVWGNAACYVPPGNTKALCEALNHLAADAEQRTHLAQLARRRAQRYTTQQCAARYWNTYQSLLPSQELRPCASSFSIIH